MRVFVTSENPVVAVVELRSSATIVEVGGALRQLPIAAIIEPTGGVVANDWGGTLNVMWNTILMLLSLEE